MDQSNLTSEWVLQVWKVSYKLLKTQSFHNSTRNQNTHHLPYIEDYNKDIWKTLLPIRERGEGIRRNCVKINKQK